MSRGLDARRVLADGALVTFATVGGGALLFLVNLYLARELGPEEFGQFRVVIALFSFLVTLIEFGQGPTLVKHIAEYADGRARDLTRKLLGFRVVCYLALAAIGLAGSAAVAEHVLQDRSRVDDVLAGVVFAVCFYFEIAKSIVLGYQRMRLYALSIGLTFLANSVLAVGSAFVFGVPGAVVGWGLGYFVGNAVNIPYLWRSRALAPAAETVDARRILLTYGLPMHVVQAAVSLELAVVPLCSLFYGRQEIGHLAFAMVFYRGVSRVAMSFSSVLLPRFAQQSAHPSLARSSVGQAMGLFTPFAVLGAVAAVALAEPIITIVDPAYVAAVPIFRILVVYGLLASYGTILTSYYAGTGRVRMAVLTTAAQQIGLIAVSFLGLQALGS